MEKYRLIKPALIIERLNDTMGTQVENQCPKQYSWIYGGLQICVNNFGIL